MNVAGWYIANTCVLSITLTLIVSNCMLRVELLYTLFNCVSCIALDNCFRKIFDACWRESAKPLLFYCGTMPVSLLVDQRKKWLPAGLRVQQPCRYCFYSEVQKWFFRPAGATRCPDKRAILHGGPLPRAKFHIYRGRNVRMQPKAVARIFVRGNPSPSPSLPSLPSLPLPSLHSPPLPFPPLLSLSPPPLPAIGSLGERCKLPQRGAANAFLRLRNVSGGGNVAAL